MNESLWLLELMDGTNDVVEVYIPYTLKILKRCMEPTPRVMTQLRYSNACKIACNDDYDAFDCANYMGMCWGLRRFSKNILSDFLRRLRIGDPNPWIGMMDINMLERLLEHCNVALDVAWQCGILDAIKNELNLELQVLINFAGKYKVVMKNQFISESVDTNILANAVRYKNWEAIRIIYEKLTRLGILNTHDEFYRSSVWNWSKQDQNSEMFERLKETYPKQYEAWNERQTSKTKTKKTQETENQERGGLLGRGIACTEQEQERTE